MSDFDAIVIGAGHNGLTAAAILQRAGLQTVVLEKNKYTGGMASTVELFDGYRFEIAGSVLFPIPDVIMTDLGLDTVPTVDTEIMAVNIGRPSDEPIIMYSKPEKLMAHIAERHGNDAVMGMAQIMQWCWAPARAVHRFECLKKPPTLDEMIASATNDEERDAIRTFFFGSSMDVIDRFLPDKERHRMLRGLLAFLAVQSTYRGPYTPGSAACLAFGFASPPEVRYMRKIEGGIGALADQVQRLYESAGGEVRVKTRAARIVVENGRVTGVETDRGERLRAPIVISNLDLDQTLLHLVGRDHLPADLQRRVERIDHRAAYVQMHFALSGKPEFVGDYEFLNEGEAMGTLGLFGGPEDMQRDYEGAMRGLVPDDPSLGFQMPSLFDPDLAPPGHHAASAYGMYFPVEAPREEHGRLKREMGQRIIDKLARLAPNFPDLILHQTTFASLHYETMFGATGGDFCQGLIHPEHLGPFRPGPRGWIDLPLPIAGLYLAGAACHGGPGVTFIPGYNCGHEVLRDLGKG